MLLFLQILAPGFTASAVVGNVTTTSLVVSNVMGTPNATALGSDDISNASLRLYCYCNYRGNTRQHCRSSYHEGM